MRHPIFTLDWFRAAAAAFIVFLSVFASLGQAEFCRQTVLKAMRPLPVLKYDCPEGTTDSDEAILRNPGRIKAITKYTKLIESFTGADWWNSSVDELTYCDIHKKAGKLSKAETEDLRGGSYFYRLFGNKQIRVVKTDDPCYQQGYGGSNIFVLYRANQKVRATEVIDGYYSRADNPVSVDFAMLGKEKLIEIATWSGGLHPSAEDYYFSINPATGRAVPKNLFRDKKGPTNQIYSSQVIGEPEEYGLPPKSEPLIIFKKGRLAKSFMIFNYAGESTGENAHELFTKTTLRWNGKYFR